MALQLTVSDEPRRKVAVISHERSGTHFLMNTLAANCDLIAKPWWDLDLGLPVTMADLDTALKRTFSGVFG